MNRVVVAQTAAGLAKFLLKRQQKGEPAPSVVVGYDARFNSDVFARDSAEIFAGHGLKAFLFPHIVPTPVLAFAVRHLNASAGVMVTASHNPPRDNGYKVYLGGEDEGSQIVSPTDGMIAKEIDEVAATVTVDKLSRSTDVTPVGEDLIDAYVAHTASLVPEPTHPLKTVYTPMHGVGLVTFNAVFRAAGFTAPIPVAEQADPDPTFRTVAFPNPEEPGAMDLAFAAAREAGAELVISNDPDADRLAVAIPSPGAEGGWAKLSGDQVGLLLGDHLATPGAKGTLACSIVSSSALGRLAEKRGLRFTATPTGFKYISRVPGLLFGYEEALGYCVNPAAVRDKDGISAALLFASMASRLKSTGKTVADRLEELGGEIGHFATSGVSVRVAELARIPAMMRLLRASPPTEIAGLPARFSDLLADEAIAVDGLRFDMEGGRRVIVRPSGTEPKLKCYLEAVGGTAAEAAAALADLEKGVRVMLAELEKKAGGL
ncbi:phosphomannomutase [Hyaloraphidium curvatum]|nr:phosphomannomutase [Hyaloraphidium curvatum]